MLSMTRLLIFALSVLALGCDSATAPNATEPVEVTRFGRLVVAGEQLPRVEMTAESGAIRFRVTTRRSPCSVVEARVRRRGSRIDIVATVAGDPAAICPAGAELTHVFGYEGLVGALEPGVFDVSVYEGGFRTRTERVRTVRVRVRK
jgi:hypothetical protein